MDEGTRKLIEEIDNRLSNFISNIYFRQRKKAGSPAFF